jgi:hypothetical protein
MEVKKAEVKVRLLTGTYMLKETKAKFSRNTDTPLCEPVQSHLHQIQYVHVAHGFPPPVCTGKKFIQDENGKIVCPFFLY